MYSTTLRCFLLSCLAVLTALIAQAAGPRRSTATGITLTPVAMTFAIEEERLAHDVYTVALEQWELPVFANIRRSESQHVAALVQLAGNFHLTVPAAHEGTYQTAELQALYDDLLPLVMASEESALLVGALIEETDIMDLRRTTTGITDATTKKVLANLEAASWHHLTAFVRNLSIRGIIYTPQVVDPDEFAARIR
jgi:hypothetical protein